jgi:hypothetical protein
MSATGEATTDVFHRVRYSPINKHLIESLVSPSLHFSHPSGLNDPFDCRIDIRGSISRAAAAALSEGKRMLLERLLKTPLFFENWQVQMERLGVCSFSNATNDALLWSHYAHNHRGLWIMYEIPEAALRTPNFGLAAGGEVDYAPDPVTAWLKNTAVEEMDEHAFIKELVLKCLKTKSPAWKYEMEARLIRLESGVVGIEPEFVTEVCFGMHCAVPDMDLITNLAQQFCGCERFSRMVPDDTDFGFTRKSL